mmetsp:Transcript_7814/g.8876  ORF Transcript_7814/g.8876 Transcript_7814/m.8876 type:complete len:111 (-) Transcript_7814:114-446(-)
MASFRRHGTTSVTTTKSTHHPPYLLALDNQEFMVDNNWNKQEHEQKQEQEQEQGQEQEQELDLDLEKSTAHAVIVVNDNDDFAEDVIYQTGLCQVSNTVPWYRGEKKEGL